MKLVWLHRGRKTSYQEKIILTKKQSTKSMQSPLQSSRATGRKLDLHLKCNWDVLFSHDNMCRRGSLFNNCPWVSNPKSNADFKFTISKSSDMLSPDYVLFPKLKFKLNSILNGILNNFNNNKNNFYGLSKGHQ